MGRLKQDLLERVESLSHRMVDVAETLLEQRRTFRITDQIVASGTSVGANTCEADEAISRKELCRCLGIAKRELAETHFWLRFVGRREWISLERLNPLIAENIELKRIMGAMIENTRRNDHSDE